MSSPHYEGLGELRNTSLHIAGFLEISSDRIAQMRPEEIANRMRDCAKVLRDSEAKAVEIYFDITGARGSQGAGK